MPLELMELHNVANAVMKSAFGGKWENRGLWGQEWTREKRRWEDIMKIDVKLIFGTVILYLIKYWLYKHAT